LNEHWQAVINTGWEQDVLPQVPADAEQQAEQLQAITRYREFTRASDLLRGLLASVLCAPSFRQMGAWAVLIGLANISHVAWRAHLRKARAWLLWLLCELLALTTTPAQSQAPAQPRILLIDATRLKQPGGSGDDWRVHLGYELLGGRLVDVHVAARHTAEGFALFTFVPGDIVIADRGYSRRSQLAAAMRQGAQLVVRLEVQKVPLLAEHGQPLDVVAWLRACQGGTQSRTVAFAYQGHRCAGRLIAGALPAEAAERARVKARRMASKQQRQWQEQTLFLAGWLLVCSSLPVASWSDAQVLALYRARGPGRTADQTHAERAQTRPTARQDGSDQRSDDPGAASVLGLAAAAGSTGARHPGARAFPRLEADERFCLSLAGSSRCRTHSRTREVCDQQWGADCFVCADLAHGRPGGLDAYTPAGLPPADAPFCVCESAPTPTAGEHDSLSTQDPPDCGRS
jgi:hypothetical protein